MQRPLIVVSNRGPVTYERDAAGDRVRRRGAGGLVAALRPLVARHTVTWIASAMNDEEREIAACGSLDEEGPDGRGFRLRLVAHEPRAYRSFYDVVANPVLWFVQHGLWDLKCDPDADLLGPWEEGYVPVNQGFADAVVEELDRIPDAVVLFQDYHLYVAPELVRARKPETRLGHFVHIPWVSPGGWDVLPSEVSQAVHAGLLANDSIGFHSERWRAAFVDCCDALLGQGEEAHDRSHVNPIAIDAPALIALVDSPAVLDREAALCSARPQKLIVRVDRTDPSKNAVVGFAAFGRLLERRPDLRGQVGMLALLDPSRQMIPEYANYRRALESAAEIVNTEFATALWTPIELRIQDDFPSSLAAFKQYDVLLVNPVMDGLNLVAKEGPLLNTQDGVLVLSRKAGAWDEIGEWAIGIDPHDVEGTAVALERALELSPEERTARAESIREHVRAQDLESWASRELAFLERQSRSTMRP